MRGFHRDCPARISDEMIIAVIDETTKSPRGRKVGDLVMRSAAFLALALISTSCSSSNEPAAGSTAPTSDADTNTEAAADAQADDPPAPYGLNVGDTLPPVSMRGRVGGAGELVEIHSRDYYDPDGARGIRALWIGLQVSCPSCDDANPWIALPLFTSSAYKSAPWSFAARGGRMLDAIAYMSNGSGTGAVADKDVDDWIKRFSSTNDVANFGKSKELTPDENLPHCYIVDPRTMKIVDHKTDVLKCKSAVSVVFDRLLVTNGAPPKMTADAGGD
jgi:hypothetical protein